LRQSPELWKDYKRRRQRLTLPALKSVLLSVLALLLAAAFLTRYSVVKPNFPFLAIAFYCTGTVVFRSRALLARLHGPGELSIFMALPLADNDFFRMQWKKLLFRSVSIFVAATLFYISQTYGSASVRQLSTVPAVLVSIYAGLLQWLLVCSLAVPALRVTKPFAMNSARILYGLVMVAAFLPDNLDQYFSPATIVLPAGWVNRLYEDLLAGKPAGLLWSVPVLGLAGASLLHLRHVRASYTTTHDVTENLLEVERDDEIPSSVSEGNKALVQDEGEGIREEWAPVLAKNRISAGELNLSPDWKAFGWIENIAGRWLTQDEKIVADFMTGGLLGQWSSAWRRGLYVMSAAMVLASLVPLVPFWGAVVAICLASALAAPVLGGQWAGFSQVIVSMNLSFVAAFYPVSYWQVSKMILKINLVRITAWFVLLAPAVMLLAWRLGSTPQDGFIIATEILIFATAFQFIAVAGKHSQGTNDTKVVSLGSVLLCFSAVLGVFALVAGMFVFFIPGVPHGPLVGGISVLAICMLAWLSYGWIYHHGRIDLVRLPDRN